MALTFNETFYLSNNADVLAAVGRGTLANALQHYNLFGQRELRNPNSTFNAREYLLQNPDLVTAFQNGTLLNVFDHYTRFGVVENRAPNASLVGFNATTYLANNPDVAAAVGAGKAFSSAMQHYLLFGAAEGRPAAGVTGGTTPGGTFTLTTGSDVLGPTSTTAATLTTANNDSIFALTENSLTSADIINAGGGTDSLTATYNLAAATTHTPVLTSVENLTIRASSANDFNLTMSLASSTGVTSFTFDQVVGANAKTYTAQGLASGTTLGLSANTTNANIFVYEFVAAALAGSADAVTFNVSGNATATGNVTIRPAATNTGANDGVETLNIVTSGTGENILGTLLVTDSGGTSRMNTLNVTGAGKLTINTLDFEGSAGTIVGSASTGALSINTSAGNDAITFTGGTANDSITTGTGNDNLNAGDGADTITPGTGADTVVGGGGNDRLVVANSTDIDSTDNFNLGDGTRDVIQIGTITALNTTNITTAIKTVLTASSAEVIGLNKADITALDYQAVSQDIVEIQGGSAVNLAVTGIQTNDTLIFANSHDITGVNAGAAVSLTGQAPGQTFRLELTGGNEIKGNAAATLANYGLNIVGNITTLQIDSTGTATNLIESQNAASRAINNVSTQSVVITGNRQLEIENTTATGMGFTSGVAVTATTFTGALVLSTSNSNDAIIGGTGNDTLRALDGIDTIDLTAGGSDIVSLQGIIAAANRDTITGFTAGSAATADKFQVVNAQTTVAQATATFQAVTQAPTTALTFTTASQDVLELAFEAATGTGKDLNASTDGTALLASLGQTLSVSANNDVGYIIAYQGGRAFLYHVADGGNATIAAGEISLVATFEGISTVGVFEPNNVVII